MSMTIPAWFSIMAIIVALIAFGMSCFLLFRPQASFSHRSLAVLLGATAIANLANGAGLLDENHALHWRAAAMIAELLQPATLLYVGLGYLDPTERVKNVSALWRVRVIGAIGLLLTASVATGHAIEWRIPDYSSAKIALTSLGYVTYVYIVVGMTLGLSQLELVLRASQEPIRHRLKFIIIGLGGLAGYQIYQASQMLLFSVWQAEHVLIGGLVTTMSLALVAYGLGRSRLREMFVNTYVSQQALVGSMTFIVIGLYLLAVGAVGEWLRRTDQPLGLGLSVIVVFSALVALAIAAFSKTVRAELRRFVVRNFYRSKYDYRARWLDVTEAFESTANREAIMDRLLDLLIKTFTTHTLSIWSFREADRRFFQARSMRTDKVPAPLELSHPVVTELVCKDEPVFIDNRTQARDASSSDPLNSGDVALCFPIRAQGKLTAFVALGRQLHGEAYGTDDCDLLSGISHHVGALLSHANLAEERQASAELEALHRFSVFCLHDLKNLAARLSLVAQNAESHGRDPAFQESVMRTVADTAQKMTALMSKLSLKSFKPTPAGTLESVNIPALIHDIVGPMQQDGTVQLHVKGGPVEPILAVREQIHQVLLNLILNAKQAVGEKGDISVMMKQQDGAIIITVDDSGDGIPANMLETLFRPSQTSRPGGLGVGLYQCKQIVEAHRGTIQMRSEVGKGTQVRIELPLSVPAHMKRETVAKSSMQN